MNCENTLALDVVGKLASATCAQDIVDRLRRFGESLGYGHFCLSEIPTDDSFTPHYYDCWPHGWIGFYLENAFHRVDPVLRALQVSIDPFRWSDVARLPDGSAGARMMRTAAEGWRMREGFAVPIHSVTGAQAAVSFVADRPDRSGEGHPALHMAAIFAHFRIEELSGRPTAPPAPDLSGRERDMLLYAAAGHANGEIAEKLNLGSRDARAHLVAATRKLGARTRTQAIVHASRAGLLGF